ncbi:MAG: hypothetical protein AB7S26_02790 [Sandaracinaceae bacterium]
MRTLQLIIGVALLIGCDGEMPSGMDAGGSRDAGNTPRDAGVGRDGATGVDGGGSDAGPPPPGELRDSLTQYGITWTFDHEYETGRFVNGDFWIVGPVQVISISPMPTGNRNGSMVDPVDDQAYDSRGGRYDGAKGVTLPLTIDAGHSLVSSISHDETPACQQGGADGWETYNGDCQRGPIDTQAVLTVLGEAPPSDAFRPAYSAHGPRLYREADICWERLPRLALPSGASMPSSAGVLRAVERPWIDHLNSWTMQHGCATNNMFCYGREIGDIVSNVTAYAMLDTPDREEVARRLIQIGIDNAGVLRAGGGWGSDGGHFNGRKWPIVFAGGMLGDAEMESPGDRVGNEDQMTYYGAGGTALWGRDCMSCYTATCDYPSGCSSGSKDCRDPAETIDGCGDYRNCCTSGTWVGEALAARLMGLDTAWGHDAFFDYVDRWMDGDVPGGGDTSGQLVSAMWDAYRDATPTMACP